MPKYYVAEITKRGWQRISRYYANVKDAQKKHNMLKREYPNTCVLVANNR